MGFRLGLLIAVKYGLICLTLYASKPVLFQTDLPFLNFPDATFYTSRAEIIQPLSHYNFLRYAIFKPDPPQKIPFLPGQQYAWFSQHAFKSYLNGDLLLIVEEDHQIIGHYFHFMEHLLGIWNYLAYQNPDQIKMIIFAMQRSSKADQKWRGNSNDVNYLLLKALFPHANMILLNELPPHMNIHADHIYVSSRVRAHALPGSGYGNMNGDARWSYQAQRLQLLRDRVFNAMQINITPRSKNLRITYSKRSTGRKMEAKLEAQLLSAITAQTKQPVKVVDFAKISYRDQLQIIANTDVLIGVHGNGLTHLVFLPDQASIIEFFDGEESAFYRTFAQMRGINYYGNTHQRWITNEYKELHNSYQNDVTEIDLSGTVNLINKIATET